MARRAPRLIFSLVTGTALSGVSVAHAVELPNGPSVVRGGVSIGQPSGNSLSINQSTGSAIVNWQGFSIGQGGRVDITQPSSSSAILNRVTGSTPSTIAGQLNANGRVFLVNPNGIAITPSGTVRAAGFVASTLGLADDDFANGKYKFSGNGRSAAVVNQGTIDISAGGYAALIGGQVDNSGTISVPLGKVGLGAGEQATLDFSGDGFLQVAVPSTGGGDGPLIKHSGTIRANGGSVVMQAATARDAARQAINLTGYVEARTIRGRSGAIVLGGGAGGIVTVSGKLDASATRTRRAAQPSTKLARGGSITVTGNDIRLQAATLDVSGRDGGGTVRIGGDYQGGGTLQRAATTSVDAATTIKADATGSGTGGSVVIWSDIKTTFAGQISALGGPDGGDGGSAEVSGKALLAYTGFSDLRAPKGGWGTLLLDPYDITISTSPTSGVATETGSTSTVLGVRTGTAYEASANSSNLNVSDLVNALNAANVLVTTGRAGDPGAQAGDINVATSIGWSSPTTLVLYAYRNINIGGAGGPVTIVVPTRGGLVLRADNSGTGTGTVTFAAYPNTGSVVTNTGSTVSIFYNPTSYTTPSTFAVSGSGTTTAYMLVNNAANLQGVSANLGGTYALGRDIDLGGAPFTPLGTFTGTFEGLNQTISNLAIASTASNVGLFSAVSGTVRDVRLANANVTGNTSVGALAGTLNAGGTILNSSSSGTVTGATSVGGLVGTVSGTLAGSSSSANVSGTSNDIGGLAGDNSGGTITGSSASGTASGSAYHVGGLVGHNYSGTITRSFATGNATTTSPTGGAGGLVGENDATITQSYATGTATAPIDAGGLVGYNTGTISQSFARGAAVGSGGTSSEVGGLAGYSSGTIADSYATGAASGTQAVGGLVGTQSGGTVARTYAVGPVSGSSGTGGLIGTATGTPSVTNSYYDTQTTGQSGSAGGTGLTTAQLTSGLPAGFDPAIWGGGGGAYPFLLNNNPLGAPVPTGGQGGGSNDGSGQVFALAQLFPDFSRQLPLAFSPANTQPDDVDAALAGLGGSSTLGGGGITRSSAAQTLAFVQRASQELERKLAQCEKAGGSAYKGCVSDALDQFAATLDTQLPNLPPSLRTVTAVIRQTAQRVRAAPNSAAARVAVRAAVSEVRKAIALIRADEPAVARLQVRQGNVIASALQKVDAGLSRAVGL